MCGCREMGENYDWEKAIRAICDLPYGDKKMLFIIDEFPYMCKGSKSIPGSVSIFNMYAISRNDACKYV